MTLERLSTLLALMCQTNTDCEVCPLNIYGKHCSYGTVLSIVAKLEHLDRQFPEGADIDV